MAVRLGQFLIRSAETNEVKLKIPRGLYGFDVNKTKHGQNIRVLASRMIFTSENRIRIIGKYGLDTILQLNFEDPIDNPVTIKSVCQMDHFDSEIPDERHAILD